MRSWKAENSPPRLLEIKAIAASQVLYFGVALLLHPMLQSHMDAKCWARAACSMQVCPSCLKAIKINHIRTKFYSQGKTQRERVPQPNNYNRNSFRHQQSSSLLHSKLQGQGTPWIETSPPFLLSQGAQQDEEGAQLWTWILNGKSAHISSCMNTY